MKLNIAKDNKIMTKSFVGTDVGVSMQIKITINMMYAQIFCMPKFSQSTEIKSVCCKFVCISPLHKVDIYIKE